MHLGGVQIRQRRRRPKFDLTVVSDDRNELRLLELGIRRRFSVPGQCGQCAYRVLPDSFQLIKINIVKVEEV